MSLEDIKLDYSNNSPINGDVSKLLKLISFNKNSSIYIFVFIKFYLSFSNQNNVNDIKDLYDEFLEWIRILRPSANFLLNNRQFKEELYKNNKRNLDLIKENSLKSSIANSNFHNILKSFHFDSFLSRPFYPSKFLVKSSVIGLIEDDLFISYNNTENYYNCYFSLPSLSCDLKEDTANVPGNLRSNLHRTRTKKEYESFVKLIQNNYESYKLDDYNQTKNNEFSVDLLINYGKEILNFKFDNERDYYHFILGLKFNKKFHFISYAGRCYHDYYETINKNFKKPSGSNPNVNISSGDGTNKNKKKDKDFLTSIFNKNNLCEFIVKDSNLTIKPVVVKIGIPTSSNSEEAKSSSYNNPSSLDNEGNSSSSSSSSSFSSNIFSIPLESIIAIVINSDFPVPKVDLLHCSMDLEQISIKMLEKNKIKLKNLSNSNYTNLRFLLKVNSSNNSSNKIYSMPMISSNYFTEYKIGGPQYDKTKKTNSLFQSFLEYDSEIFNNTDKNIKLTLYLMENNTVISKSRLKNLFVKSKRVEINSPSSSMPVSSTNYSAKLLRKLSTNYDIKRKRKQYMLNYRNISLIKFNLLKKNIKKYLYIKIVMAEELNDSNKGAEPSPYCVLVINEAESKTSSSSSGGRKKLIKNNIFNSKKTFQTSVEAETYSPAWNKTFILDLFDPDASPEDTSFPFSSISVIIKDSSSGILQHKHLGMISLLPECFLPTKVSLKLPLERSYRMSDSPKGCITLETEMITKEDYDDDMEEDMVEIESELENSEHTNQTNEEDYWNISEDDDEEEDEPYVEEFDLEETRDFIPISYQILHTTALSTWWPYKLISHKVNKSPAVFQNVGVMPMNSLSSISEDAGDSHDEYSAPSISEITDPYQYMDGHILTHPYGLLLNINGSSILTNMKQNLSNSIKKDITSDNNPLLLEEIINNPNFILMPWNQINRVLEVSKSTILVEILVDSFYKNSINNNSNNSFGSFTYNITSSLVSSLNPISNNPSSSSSTNSTGVPDILLEIVIGPCNSKLLISAIENRLRNNNVRLLVNSRNLLINDNSKVERKLTKSMINSITFSKLLDQINKAFSIISQELNNSKDQSYEDGFSFDVQHSITDLIVHIKEIKKILFKQYKYINSRVYKEILFEQVVEQQKEEHIKYKIKWENLKFSLFISLLDQYPIHLLNLFLIYYKNNKISTFPLSLSIPNDPTIVEAGSDSQISIFNINILPIIVNLVNYAYPETSSILPIEPDQKILDSKNNKKILAHMNSIISVKLKQVIETQAKKINLLEDNYSLNTNDFMIKLARFIHEEMIPLIFSFRQFIFVNNIKYDIKEGISVITQSFWNFYHDFISDYLISFRQYSKIKGVNNQSLFALFLINELDFEQRNISFFLQSIRPMLSLLFNIKIEVPMLFKTLNMRYCYAYEGSQSEKQKLTKRDSYNKEEEKSVEIIQKFLIKRKSIPTKDKYILTTSSIDKERRTYEHNLNTLNYDSPIESIKLWYLSILLGQMKNCILSTLELGKADNMESLIPIEDGNKKKKSKNGKESREKERLSKINDNLTSLNAWEIIRMNDGERLTHLPAILIGQLKVILEYSLTYRNLRKKIISSIIIANIEEWYPQLSNSGQYKVNYDQFFGKLKAFFHRETIETNFFDNIQEVIENKFFRKILADEQVNEIVEGLNSAEEYDENDGEMLEFDKQENEFLSALIQYAYSNYTSTYSVLHISYKIPYILMNATLYVVEEYFKKLKSANFLDLESIPVSVDNVNTLSILPSKTKSETGCSPLNEYLVSIINDLHYIEHHMRVLMRISSGNRSSISSMLLVYLRPPIIRVQRAAAVKIMRSIYDDLTTSLLNFDEMWLGYVSAIKLNEDNSLEYPISNSNFYNPVKNITSYIVSTCSNIKNFYGCHVCDVIEIFNLSFDILISRFLMMFKHRIKSSNSSYNYNYHVPTKKWSSNSKISLNQVQTLALKNDAEFISKVYNANFKSFIKSSEDRKHSMEKDFLVIMKEFFGDSNTSTPVNSPNKSILPPDPVSPYHLVGITSFHYFAVSICANYDSLDFINSIRWIIKNSPLINTINFSQGKKETPLSIVNHIIYNVILQLRSYNNDACSFYQDCIENLIQEKDTCMKSPFRSSTIIQKAVYDSPINSPFLGSLHTNVTIKDSLFKIFYLPTKNVKGSDNKPSDSSGSSSNLSTFSLSSSTSSLLKALKSGVPKIRSSEDAFVSKLVSMLFGVDTSKSVGEDYINLEDDIVVYDDLNRPLYKVLDSSLGEKSMSTLLPTYLQERFGKSFKSLITTLREKLKEVLKDEILLSKYFETKEIKKKPIPKTYEAEKIAIDKPVQDELGKELKKSLINNQALNEEEIKEGDFSAGASSGASVTRQATPEKENLTQEAKKTSANRERSLSFHPIDTSSISPAKVKGVSVLFQSLQIKYIAQKNASLLPTVAFYFNDEKKKLKLSSQNLKRNAENNSKVLESSEEISFHLPSSSLTSSLKLPVVHINVYTKNFLTKKKHFYSKISIENLSLLSNNFKLEKKGDKSFYSAQYSSTFNLFENESEAESDLLGKISLNYKVLYNLKPGAASESLPTA